MPDSLFPSKIMLFGEYVVLLKAKALVTPFFHFSGSLQFRRLNVSIDNQVRESQHTLINFYRYIAAKVNQTNLVGLFDLKAFERDIRRGLYFNSTIPAGYGVGSSGALTAAVYDRYVEKRENMINARKHLAYLESFFHTNSSGVDPLVSYFNKPVLTNDTEVELIEFPLNAIREIGIALIDTATQRETGLLVKRFLAKCQEPSYLSLFQQLISYNNNSIDALLQRKNTEFWPQVLALSAFQLKHFGSMIPISSVKLWEKGLLSGDYAFKLCGAGGGGYLLAFINDYDSFLNEMSKHNLSVLPVTVCTEQ